MRTLIGSFPASETLPRQSAAVGAGFAAIAAGTVVAIQPTLGLLAVAAISGGIALLVWPEWATIVVVLALFADVPSVLVNAHGVPAGAAALLPFLLLLPLAAAVRQGQGLIGTPLLMLLAVYFLAELASTLQAFDSTAALDRLRTFAFEGVLTYALVTNVIRDGKTLRRATWAVVVAGAFLGGLALWQQLTHGFYRTYGGFASVSSDFYFGLVDKPRLQGPIGDPNYFAQVLLVAVPLALLLGAGAATRARSWIAVACAALATAGIVLTTSRGAVVALAVVFLCMVFLGHVRRRHLFILVVGFAISLAAVPTYRHRVSSLVAVGHASRQPGAQAGADESVRARSTEMRAALLAFDAHPVLGVGPGNFPLYYQQYAARAGGEVHARVRFGPDKGSTPERQAHNIFLSVAADLGTVGLAIFVAILGLAGRMLLRARRRFMQVRDHASAALAAGYLTALVAYVTSGLFLSLAYERYLWLLLALAAVAAGLSLRAEPSPVRAGGSDGIDPDWDGAPDAEVAERATLHAIVTGSGADTKLLVLGRAMPLFGKRPNAERVVAEVTRMRLDADLGIAVVTQGEAWSQLLAAYELDGMTVERRDLLGIDHGDAAVPDNEVLEKIAAAIVEALDARRDSPSA